MAKNNTVTLIGFLAGDVVFEAVKTSDGASTVPYIRFFLVVPRTAEQMSKRDRAGDAPARTDIIRVVEYGHRAEADYYYLSRGAEVAVVGWLQSREYFDRAAQRKRTVLEVNAERVVYGRGCDFERGDAMRRELEARQAGDVAEPQPVSPDELAALLAAMDGEDARGEGAMERMSGERERKGAGSEEGEEGEAPSDLADYVTPSPRELAEEWLSEEGDSGDEH